jgi:predicted aspartyl protease
MKIMTLCILGLSILVAEAKDKNKESDAFVRFEFAANTSLVLVPVYVNGRGPYRFLLDTGASHSILAVHVADALEIRPGRTEELITAGGPVRVTLRNVEKLQIGSVRMDRQPVAVADLALLRRLGVDGILGGDRLKSFNLYIDYARQILRIEPSTVPRLN